MKKEEYIEKRKQNTVDARKLKDDLITLTNDYIEANTEFTVGQKVIVTDNKNNEELGFISGIFVGYDAEIEYKFWKMKKDGTPSQHQLWAWSGHTIRAFY